MIHKLRLCIKDVHTGRLCKRNIFYLHQMKQRNLSPWSLLCYQIVVISSVTSKCCMQPCLGESTALAFSGNPAQYGKVECSSSSLLPSLKWVLSKIGQGTKEHHITIYLPHDCSHSHNRGQVLFASIPSNFMKQVEANKEREGLAGRI